MCSRSLMIPSRVPSLMSFTPKFTTSDYVFAYEEYLCKILQIPETFRYPCLFVRTVNTGKRRGFVPDWTPSKLGVQLWSMALLA